MIWPILRNAAVLMAGIVVVAWGLSRMTEVGGDGSAATLQARPQAARLAQQTGDDGYELVIAAGRNGHFFVDAEINGAEIAFLVDTGASTVVLTAQDAERIGFHLGSLEFNARMNTANGVILGAPVILRDLRIGDLEIEDVRATVIQAPMSRSLLGMSFLGRLGSYAMEDGRLVLRW